MDLGKKILGEEFSEQLEKEQKERERLEPIKNEPHISFLWYLLPFLFGFLGGLIGWALLREKSKKHAGQLLIVGLVMTGIAILFEWLK